jgi:hypothetical protein
MECVPIDSNLLRGAVHIPCRPLGWCLVWFFRGKKSCVREGMSERCREKTGNSLDSAKTYTLHYIVELDDVNTTCRCNIFYTATLSFFGSVETTLQCIVGSVTAQEHPLETTDASFHQDNPRTRSPARLP